jgi:phosphoglycerate dehydrogenase-like enzyme
VTHDPAAAGVHSQLTKLPFFTPHIGGVTDLSMRGIVKVVAENIRRVARKEEPLYCKQPVVSG